MAFWKKFAHVMFCDNKQFICLNLRKKNGKIFTAPFLISDYLIKEYLDGIGSFKPCNTKPDMFEKCKGFFYEDEETYCIFLEVE